MAKLCLVSLVLWLVSLAIADQPTMKILYDSDFVIAEANDFSKTSLSYVHYPDYDTGDVSFSATSVNSDHFFETMKIRKGFEKQTSNFTVEVYSNYPKNYIPAFDHFCRDNSSEALRVLIKECFARTLLREMTVEEQAQMKAFKEQQKKKPNRAKVIFGQNEKIKIQVPGTTRDFAMGSTRFGRTATAENRTIIFTTFDKRITYVSMYFMKQWLPYRFAIEGLPDGSGVNCNETEFRNVKPFQCEGQIKLRELTEDD